MHLDTMGLSPINPLWFSQWAREASPNLWKIPFPSREQYGIYLKELLVNVIDDAKKLGVKFQIINSEAVDVAGNGEFMEVILAD